jgi:predicted  nucleic acid-binding Zn-ribbon protein
MGSENTLEYWQLRYRTLLTENNLLRNSNAELEDKLLNIIEKTERQKALLSDEIDHISERLKHVSNNYTKLEEKCVSVL